MKYIDFLKSKHNDPRLALVDYYLNRGKMKTIVLDKSTWSKKESDWHNFNQSCFQPFLEDMRQKVLSQIELALSDIDLKENTTIGDIIKNYLMFDTLKELENSESFEKEIGKLTKGGKTYVLENIRQNLMYYKEDGEVFSQDYLENVLMFAQSVNSWEETEGLLLDGHADFDMEETLSVESLKKYGLKSLSHDFFGKQENVNMIEQSLDVVAKTFEMSQKNVGMGLLKIEILTSRRGNKSKGGLYYPGKNIIQIFCNYGDYVNEMDTVIHEWVHYFDDNVLKNEKLSDSNIPEVRGLLKKVYEKQTVDLSHFRERLKQEIETRIIKEYPNEHEQTLLLKNLSGKLSELEKKQLKDSLYCEHILRLTDFLQISLKTNELKSSLFNEVANFYQEGNETEYWTRNDEILARLISGFAHHENDFGSLGKKSLTNELSTMVDVDFPVFKPKIKKFITASKFLIEKWDKRVNYQEGKKTGYRPY